MDTIDKIFMTFLYIMLGVAIGIFIMGAISFNHPEQMRGVEKLLDKDKYTVDTTRTIHGNATIYNYEFIKIKK